MSGALALAACGDDGPPDAAPQDSVITQVNRDQTTTIPPSIDRDAAVAAAIDIRAAGCGPRVRFGSGTSIPDDLILTAAHVVSGASDIEVIDSTGFATEAAVVFFDPDLDVAVLRPSTPAGEPIQMRAEPAREQEIGIVVLSRLIADTVETEIIDVRVLRQVNILTTDIYLDKDVERDGFEVTAPIEPGDSGAMVHLPGGGVGIIWARSTDNEDHAWAVNIPDILLDPDARGALQTQVDNGQCTG
ncbi:MAG: trypsin-like peptidase domain-containing protein [Actinobacteria bacterium]|nr:trypsin-like peptidase domain-containing protein [Actinomycetota bacterium]